jgi:uncharacterized LabA/DUF88 family protein
VNKDFKPPKIKNDMTSYLASLVKNKRVGLFIDAANLYHSASMAGLKINFTSIYDWFNKKSKLEIANFYSAFDPEDSKQMDFLKDLEDIGYRVVKKPIKIYTSNIKGNMDIEIAVDSLLEKDKYDILILISGDGDFQYLVQALDKLEKKTIVVSVGGFTSFDLHQEADSYFFLNRISKVWQVDEKTLQKQRARNKKTKKVPPIIIMDGENKTPITSANLENEAETKTKSPKKTTVKTRPKVKVKVSKKTENKPKIIV